MDQPSSSSSKQQPQLTPEFLQAMTEHFLSIQSTQKNQQTFTFGDITLKPLSASQSTFRTKEKLKPEQQILIDYLWNARNRSQMTMAVHALSAYLDDQNQIKKALPKEVMQEMPFLPNPKATAALKEAEMEISYLQKEIRRLSTIEEDCKMMKDYFKDQQQQEAEQYGIWKRIPAYLSPAHEQVLAITYADTMGEQIHYQQTLRRMARQKQKLGGLTFVCETFSDEEAHIRGFSFITCSVNLRNWTESLLIEGQITLNNLIKYGLVRKLIVSEKGQLKFLTSLEKLRLLLAAQYDENPKGIFECEIQAIPPSYDPKYLDNVRNLITVRELVGVTQSYVVIPHEAMISEEMVDILDQMNSYRAMVSKKPYFTFSGMKLLAEDRHNKIFGPWKMDNSFIKNSFSGQAIPNPEEALYYARVKAYHVTTLSGDLTQGPYPNPTDDEDDGSTPARLSDTLDDIGIQNINNTMET